MPPDTAPPDTMQTGLELPRTVWRILTPPQRRQLLWLQLVTVLMSLSTLGGVAAIIPFFSVLADPSSIERHALLRGLYTALEFEDTRAFVVFLGASFVAIAILSSAVTLLGTLAISRFALRIGREFHVALYEEYLHRDYLFHVRSGSVTLMNNVLHEIARAVTGIIQSGMNLAASVLTCTLIILSIMWLNPLLALAAAALFVAAYALIFFALRRRLAHHGRREAELWDGLLRTLTESFGGIRDIQLRASQAYYRDVFAAQCAALERLGARMQVMAQSPRYVLECLMAALLVIAALWLQRGSASAFWLAQLSYLAFAAYRLLPAMQQGYAALVRIRADRSAFQRVAHDLERARSGVRPPPPSEQQLAAWRSRPKQLLRARGLSFRYSADDPLAVRAVTLDIPAGSLVGFVGANGSGKTTLADLVMGLLQPLEGQVEVDGMALDAHNLPAWRANVAHVPQNVILSDASLRENIVPGVPAEQVDALRLRAAITAAQLDALVASLRNGLEHRIGERGARLSGGQRQRVGIARALYSRASLLVLDEATSSLDGRAERAIVATLASLRGKLTTIVIAHRMDTLRDCDMIFEFDGGALIGGGTFAELSRDSAHFRGLTGEQA